MEQESSRKDLEIKDHTTYLVPDTLIASSKPLDSSAKYLDGTDDKESIKKAKRVHIVGDAGKFFSISFLHLEVKDSLNCF